MQFAVRIAISEPHLSPPKSASNVPCDNPPGKQKGDRILTVITRGWEDSFFLKFPDTYETAAMTEVRNGERGQHRL